MFEPAPGSLTAQDYINAQLALESEARDALPYSFDSCTRPMGRLRQPVYSCKTCAPSSDPPGFGVTRSAGAAALCYSCSISCHGDHELVEIFEKRDVACDCGTERIKGVRCALMKVVDEKVDEGLGQQYGQNYWGRFCVCEVDYEPESESGTMYQCLLGDVCGEDWFHDTCVVGLGPPEYHKKKEVKEGDEGAKTNGKEEEEQKEKMGVDGKESEVKPKETPEDAGGDDDDDPPPPPGFPRDESFEHFICWRCVDSNPWLKRYAGLPGFHPVPHKPTTSAPSCQTSTGSLVSSPPPATTINSSTAAPSNKRKLETPSSEPSSKRAKTPEPTSIKNPDPASSTTPCVAPPLPSAPTPSISLFLPPHFRVSLCHCPTCFPLLAKHRCLLEEEETYSPPEDGSEDRGGSVYDAGEKALQEVDRVQALRGVMAYNLLKEKVKGFLRPFAESGQVVGEGDVRGYFEGLKK